MDTEAMLDRARLVLSDRARYGDGMRPWAEALLAVEAARVEAVRERDYESQSADHHMRRAGFLADEVDSLRSQIKKATERFGKLVDEWQDSEQRRIAAEVRAEQAERERDQKRDESMRNYRWGSEMTSRVAALEGALRDAREYVMSSIDLHARDRLDMRAIIDAALGDQEAPTEPGWWDSVPIPSKPFAAPQVAPEPERPEYRIALRPDHEGHLDDVVVRDVAMFRMEDMGDSWWLCCYLNGEPDMDRICWAIGKDGRATVTEYPDGDVAYEPGSLVEGKQG